MMRQHVFQFVCLLLLTTHFILSNGRCCKGVKRKDNRFCGKYKESQYEGCIAHRDRCKYNCPPPNKVHVKKQSIVKSIKTAKTTHLHFAYEKPKFIKQVTKFHSHHKKKGIKKKKSKKKQTKNVKYETMQEIAETESIMSMDTNHNEYEIKIKPKSVEKYMPKDYKSLSKLFKASSKHSRLKRSHTIRRRRLFDFTPDQRVKVGRIKAGNWKKSVGLFVVDWNEDGTPNNHCTATFIQRKHLITAGHCVYDDEYWEDFDEMRFYPGHTFHNIKKRYRKERGIKIERAFIPHQWWESEDISYDYAIVRIRGRGLRGRMQAKPLGLAPFIWHNFVPGVGEESHVGMSPSHYNRAGFPYDKDPMYDGFGDLQGGTEMYSSSNFKFFMYNGQLEHRLPDWDFRKVYSRDKAFNGESGSAVITQYDAKIRAILSKDWTGQLELGRYLRHNPRMTDDVERRAITSDEFVVYVVLNRARIAIIQDIIHRSKATEDGDAWDQIVFYT
eukprot:65885_1